MPLSHQSSLLDQWTQFLIQEALIPANQISTDDFAGSLANQTNLAIKGIVGIRAMAEIARLLGDDTKSQNYSVRAGRLSLFILFLLAASSFIVHAAGTSSRLRRVTSSSGKSSRCRVMENI